MPPRRTMVRVRPPMRRRGRRAGVRKLYMGRNRARQPIHYFKRTAYYNGYISGSTTSDTGGALIGQLNQVPGYTEFTSLFDQYKIMAMKIRLSPRADSAEIGTNQGLIKVFTAIDYDGGTAPTNIAGILQNESLKVSKANRDHVRYFRPRYNVNTTAVAGTGYKSTRGWLDCDNASVAHHGLQFVIQQLPAGVQSWDIVVTYYLAFKNVV